MKKVYLIGGGMILLSLLIVLSAIFVPRIVSKNQMKDILHAMTKDAAYMTVGDPLYETGDLLGNRGKSVILTKEQINDVQSLLSSLCDGGYRLSGEEKAESGTMDLCLRARNEAGEHFSLYFEETTFYFLKGDLVVSFSPKDDDAYRTLFEKLNSILAE